VHAEHVPDGVGLCRALSQLFSHFFTGACGSPGEAHLVIPRLAMLILREGKPIRAVARDHEARLMCNDLDYIVTAECTVSNVTCVDGQA